MESENRIASRNRLGVAIMASHFIFAVVWFALPAEGFHLPARQQVVPARIPLFSQQGNEQDSPIDANDQSERPRLRRYQGRMMKRTVVAAKPEPILNFVKLLGQDVQLDQRGSVESPGMFRPSPEGAEDVRTDPSSQILTVDDSDVTRLHITGGLIEEKTEARATPKPIRGVKESETIETQNVEAGEKETLQVENIENLEAEVGEENINEAKDEDHEIDQDLASSEEITKADASSEIEEDDDDDDDDDDDEEEEETIAQAEDEDENNEEIEAKSSTEENSETESIDAMHPDTSELEKEEDEKMEVIQEKIEMRKQQQAELEKMEEDLLRRTEEIKMRKEELMRLEDEFARAESEIKSDSEMSAEAPENETTEEIPHYSPEEYNALSQEEKFKLKRARDAIKKSSGDNSHSILGPVIADLGYKRVHIVASGRLGTIPVWKKKRNYKYSRVDGMATEKEKQMHLGFPGIICLYEDSTGKLSIIDGQHRVGMMQALRKNRKKLKEGQSGEGEQDHEWNEEEDYFQNVLVEVYSEPSAGNTIESGDKDIDYREQLFQEINKAEPLRS